MYVCGCVVCVRVGVRISVSVLFISHYIMSFAAANHICSLNFSEKSSNWQGTVCNDCHVICCYGNLC